VSKKAIYPGTFDPFTNGHLEILTKALDIFDEVIVAVAYSVEKKPMFDMNDRIDIIKIATKGLKGVKIVPFNTLTVDLAKNENVEHIVRGIRTNADFEYELQMSYANSSLMKNLNTIFLVTNLDNSYVSSSTVRQIIKFNGDISHLVSEDVYKHIKALDER
jgi:pantetheine-phosphate adenylyltransferase